MSALAACLMTAFPSLPGFSGEGNFAPAASSAAMPRTGHREPLSELDQAVRDLSDNDAAVRKHALDRIAWLGEKAKPALANVRLCLYDPMPEVRAYAAKTLWELDPPSTPAAVKTLESLIDSTQPGLRPLAAFFLGYIGPEASPALPALKRALANSASTEQLQIAEAVARINPEDPDAVNVLLGGLSDPESGVRFQAAYALGEVSPIHAEKVLPGLAVALRDQNPQVRQAAELALKSLEHQRTLLVQTQTQTQTLAQTQTRTQTQPQTVHEPAGTFEINTVQRVHEPAGTLEIKSTEPVHEPVGETELMLPEPVRQPAGETELVLPKPVRQTVGEAELMLPEPIPEAAGEAELVLPQPESAGESEIVLSQSVSESCARV